jgi:hypothetical protein
MNDPTYPAARAVSPRLHAHFSSCRDAAVERATDAAAAVPDESTIEEMLSAAFWASLRREEGRSPTVSLAYVSSADAFGPLTFSGPLPLEPELLARLAPAVERPGIHLGVWHGDGGLRLWGATTAIPRHCFVVEVIEPGLMVVKRRRSREETKYANVAVLQGDQVKMVDEGRLDQSDRLPHIASLLGFASSRAWRSPLNPVVQLALSMRAHRHGGLLLIVPHGSYGWLDSITQPINYKVEPSFLGLSGLLEQDEASRARTEWRRALDRAVDWLGGLTAVDGATVMSDRYELLAFGAKIRRSPSGDPVERVVVVEPVAGAHPLVADPSQLGGTRHMSAAQFVQDQREGVALVASQDGRFTIFGWPHGQDSVHAYRVETLLF